MAKKGVFLLFCLLWIFSLGFLSSVVWADQGGAANAISSARSQLVSCFDAVRGAEAAGANVTFLTWTLNEAGLLLSKAEFAFLNDDFNAAQDYAVQSQGKLANFISDANALLNAAWARGDQDFLISFVGSIVITVAVLLGSLELWSVFKKKYQKICGKRKLNLQQWKAVFLAVTGILALLTSAPALQKVLAIPQAEPFTQIWLLGPEHIAEGFPSNITRGEIYNVFIGVLNRLGKTAYYSIQLKLRNESQSAPNRFASTASSLKPLYNLNVFVADKESWESSVTFSFDYSTNGNPLRVDFGNLFFNGVDLSLDGFSTLWDPAKKIFFGNIIFEVWLYNSTIDGFQYHERYVDLKLNYLS